MQRQRKEMVPIGEVFSDLDEPVKKALQLSPQARHHFTQADQVNQLLSANEADPDLGFKAKAFGRAYGFLALILPYTSAEWEKSSIFLNFLVPISLRPWKRIFPKASLSPSTWTATGSRRSRRSESAARLDRSACVVTGRLRHTGTDASRQAPPCVVFHV